MDPSDAYSSTQVLGYLAIGAFNAVVFYVFWRFSNMRARWVARTNRVMRDVGAAVPSLHFEPPLQPGTCGVLEGTRGDLAVRMDVRWGTRGDDLHAITAVATIHAPHGYRFEVGDAGRWRERLAREGGAPLTAGQHTLEIMMHRSDLGLRVPYPLPDDARQLVGFLDGATEAAFSALVPAVDVPASETAAGSGACGAPRTERSW